MRTSGIAFYRAEKEQENNRLRKGVKNYRNGCKNKQLLYEGKYLKQYVRQNLTVFFFHRAVQSVISADPLSQIHGQ
jgi:hypothetical protein